MTLRGNRLFELGMAIGVAVAAMAFSPPLASAAPVQRPSTVKGFSEEPTSFGSLAACQHVFTGPVTFANAIGHIKADIDSVMFFCGTGTSVTANNLPWKLDLQTDVSYTLSGVDVDINTADGTCRYTGSVDGVTEGAEIGPNVYDLRGTFSRQTGGCGGPEQIDVSNLIEVVSAS